MIRCSKKYIENYKERCKAYFVFCIVLYLLTFHLQALDLPVPYRLPRELHGGREDCRTCSGRGRNRANLHNPGIQRNSGNMVMTIPLIESHFLDIDNLLTIKLGAALPFRPGEYFMVMPPGTDNAFYLVFRVGPDKISFKASSGTMDSLEMTTPDEPSLKLIREDKFIVVRNHENLQDYLFEQVKFSDGWRLREIRRIDAPQIKLRCTYNEKSNLLEEILLPGNYSYKFSYGKDQTITQMSAPDGEFTKFEYDAFGNIKSVNTYLSSKHPLHPNNNGLPVKKKGAKIQDELIRSITAEYDESGKLLKTRNMEGELHSAEYRLDNDKKTMTTILETVLTEPDGGQRYFIRRINSKEKTISTTEGRITRTDAKSLEVV